MKKFSIDYEARLPGAAYHPIVQVVEAPNQLEALMTAQAALHEQGYETGSPIKVTDITDQVYSQNRQQRDALRALIKLDQAREEGAQS